METSILKGEREDKNTKIIFSTSEGISFRKKNKAGMVGREYATGCDQGRLDCHSEGSKEASHVAIWEQISKSRE
jgi:hypothetical protein